MDFDAVNVKKGKTKAKVQAAPEKLSLEVIKPSFALFVEQIRVLDFDAGAIVVKDSASVELAVTMGGQAKKVEKLIEEKRKEAIREPSEFVKSVNGFCKQFTEKLSSVQGILKKKIGDYQYRVEIERRQAEAAAQQAARDLQIKLDTEAKEKGVTAPTVVTPVIPEQKTTVRTETGTTSYQVKRWVAQIMDATLVPREYCEPSQRLIDQAVKMGIRDIPGVQIEEVTEMRFRT